MNVIDRLAGGLVVSCQARADNPLHGPVHMAAMARAADRGGAVGLRAEGRADVAAMRAASALPIIGIRKDFDAGAVYITPTLQDAAEVVAVGADVVAVDATDRPRKGGLSAAQLITRVTAELAVPVMADVDSLAAGLSAAEAGAALVATTLSGYTGGPVPAEPDLALVEALAAHDGILVVAEGRLHTPEQVARAFDAGAHAVVVGTAITNPWRITERFARATPSCGRPALAAQSPGVQP